MYLGRYIGMLSGNFEPWEYSYRGKQKNKMYVKEKYSVQKEKGRK